MIVIINGSLGVGKTTVADRLANLFDSSVMIEGDAFGAVFPFEIYDDDRIAYLYKTIAHTIAFHRNHGHCNFVVEYVFESADSLEDFLQLLRPMDSDIRVFRLTCDMEELRERVEIRGREEVDWEFNRIVELTEIQDAAALEGFIGDEIDTTIRSADEVSADIWSMITK
jgi:broad-specificity NMP kinase